MSCGLAASLAGRGSTDNAACLRCGGERDSRHQVLAEEQDRAQEAFFTLVPEPTHGLMGLGLLRATYHHRRSRR